MKYKLHYAVLGSNEINSFEFNKHSSMIDFIDSKCIDRNGTLVWLIARDYSLDIFISESYLSIQDFMGKKYSWQVPCAYYLQEYHSYEEAYKVALNMCEESPLCYERRDYLSN